MHQYTINYRWYDQNNKLYTNYFEVGDKVKYKSHPNVTGKITQIVAGLGEVIINNTLIAKEDEIELDVDVYIDNQPLTVTIKNYGKCTCSIRDLMMKGCTKHE